MNELDWQYANLMEEILEDGYNPDDRTKVGTKEIFGAMMKAPLQNKEGESLLPATTLRKVAPRWAFEELMFMLRGETDTKKLSKKGIPIWEGNTTSQFQKARGLSYLPEGDFGRMYGAQLRKFTGVNRAESGKNELVGYDQLAGVVRDIQKKIEDPQASEGRRLLTTHFNPTEASEGVLFPCHIITQFNVRGNKLDCLFWMRSSDVGYGLPYNLMYYGIFCHMMAKLVGLEAGKLVYQSGHCHLYNDQIESGLIEYMLDNIPKPSPTMSINKDYTSLTEMLGLEWADIAINYKAHPDFEGKPKMAI